MPKPVSVVLLAALLLSCGQDRAVPITPDGQTAVDFCLTDDFPPPNGDIDHDQVWHPDLGPGPDHQACPPLPSCNWCGGSATVDAKGCTTGWTCANGADPCTTQPCSGASDCLPTEICKSDKLCWPLLKVDAGVAP